MGCAGQPPFTQPSRLLWIAAQQGGFSGNTEQLCIAAMARKQGVEQRDRLAMTSHRRQRLGDADGGEPVARIAPLKRSVYRMRLRMALFPGKKEGLSQR